MGRHGRWRCILSTLKTARRGRHLLPNPGSTRIETIAGFVENECGSRVCAAANDVQAYRYRQLVSTREGWSLRLIAHEDGSRGLRRKPPSGRMEGRAQRSNARMGKGLHGLSLALEKTTV
mmetsp:Transcript_1730/g.10674  ORF Transcript_1730/g.10674 Transcript_1730/m.10674 type:complete len:120 (+) Transcript_1730:50-409(+)